MAVLLFTPAAPVWASDATALPDGNPEAAKDLGAARKMVKAGNYSQAIPRLLKVLSDAPDSQEAVEAHYELGLAYEAIQDVRNAQLELKKYLERAPDGEFAEDARTRAAAMESAVGPAQGQADLDAKIAAARTKVAQAPEDIGPRLELADLLWTKEDYPEAGKVYLELLAKWPKLADDTLVRQRMYKDSAGAWRVLDPDTAVRQAAQKDPLMIFNTSAFRSTRETGLTQSFQNRRYNVTGEAMNRSPDVLNNVELTVTILGLGNKIFEVKTVPVGRLAPGDSRPFNVTFENFDSIDNITDYRVKGSFSR